MTAKTGNPIPQATPPSRLPAPPAHADGSSTATEDPSSANGPVREGRISRWREQALAVARAYPDDIRNLLRILAGWAVLLAILPPQHEYPIIDDWIYAGSVQDMLRTGAFHMPDMSQANLIGHTLWGALWAGLFGFSFTTLTYSTLFWSVVALVSFYLICRLLGVAPRGALLGAALLGLNPMFVHLSYSFMTDVPFLALVLLSCLCYIRGLRTGSMWWYVWGGVFCGWSFLIRQFGGLVVIVFVVCLAAASLIARESRWRRIIVPAGAMAVAPMLVFVVWYVWIRTPLTPTAMSAASRASAYVMKEPWLRVFLLRAFCILPLTSLFVLGAATIKRARWWLVPAWLVALAFALYLVDLPGEFWIAVFDPPFTARLGPFSYEMSNEAFSFGAVGNIIRTTGIDFFEYVQRQIWTPEAWRGLWFVGELLSSILLAKVTGDLWDRVRRFADARLARHPKDPLPAQLIAATPVTAFYLLGVTIFVVSLAFPGDLFDRYILGFLPFLILYVVRGSRNWGRIAWVYALAALVLLGVFTVLAKADQIDHDNARWEAANWMKERVGLVHAGFDWDNWNGGGSETYQVADLPLDGFHVVARFPYTCRLCGFTAEQVLAQARTSSSWWFDEALGVVQSGDLMPFGRR